MKEHGITVNEAYAVLTTEHDEAIKKARKGYRFVSWETGERYTPTKEEAQNSKNVRFLKNPIIYEDESDD
jgi:hypothetical protein